MARQKQAKAAKDYPEFSIKKGDTYYYVKSFRGPKRMKKEPFTARELAAMGGSRSDRLTVVQLDAGEAKEKVEALVDRIDKWLADHGDKTVPPNMPEQAQPDLVFTEEERSLEVDFSDLEELQGEMESWRDNMDGTGLENTPKYEEVDECASALDDLVSTAQGIDVPTVPEHIVFDKDAKELKEALESYANDLSEIEDAGIDFPGMY